MTAGIRAYLEIRTSRPGSFNQDGSRQLISSNLPGTSQVFRLDAGQLDDAPLPPDELVQLTDHAEPVWAGYLPGRDRLLLTADDEGNERWQLYLADDDPAAPMGLDDLEALVVDPGHIHRAGGVTRDGRRLAYGTNARNGVDFDVRVRDLDSGRDREVHAPGGWTSPAGWSPSGRWLAVSELTTRPGDNRMHLLEPGTGRRVEVAPHDEGREASVGAPSWLPDESAAFVSTDVGREVPAVCRLEPGADGAVDGRDLEVVVETGWPTGCGVDWEGRHLLVTWNEDGISRAELRDPRSLERVAEVPLPGDGVAGSYRFSRDGRHLAFGFSSSRVPGDAWRWDTVTGELTRLTVSPSAVDPGTFVEPDLVRLPSFDGLEVPAFVFRPRDAGPDRTPVVVLVHGGPESQYRPSFGAVTQYLVAGGFAVLAPNVRGSTGYGRTYQHLDDVEQRRDAIRDLAAVHDWVAGTADLDPGRCALHGGSYGGYMVLAGLSLQPERWAAGVSRVGISSLVTFLENTAEYRRAFREREYGSLEEDRALLEELSPLNHVGDIRAPLLSVHGANDPRVPVGEAEQMHEVLTQRGVDNELLVYADEGHGLSKLTNRVDAYPRVVRFLEEHLRP